MQNSNNSEFWPTFKNLNYNVNNIGNDLSVEIEMIIGVNERQFSQ